MKFVETEIKEFSINKNSKVEKKLEHPEFETIDKFSMMDIVILEKMSIKKRSKNIFDFKIVVQNKNEGKLVIVETDENCLLYNINNEDVWKMEYLVRANLKNNYF